MHSDGLMMARLQAWVDEVEYKSVWNDDRPFDDSKGWEFNLDQDREPEGVAWLDRHPGVESRKWRLSRWMVKSEVINTCFMAVMAAEEHEIRERFKYRGQAIYGPHYNVDVLAEARRKGGADEMRPDSMEGGADKEWIDEAQFIRCSVVQGGTGHQCYRRFGHGGPHSWSPAAAQKMDAEYHRRAFGLGETSGEDRRTPPDTPGGHEIVQRLRHHEAIRDGRCRRDRQPSGP